MLLDKKIRKNSDGEYIMAYANHFDEAVEYACQIGITQILFRGVVGSVDAKIDFTGLEKLSKHLRVISFADQLENIANFESIYSLNRLERIYFQSKQHFTIDISKFSNLVHLGGEYWKGLVNFNQALSLKSIVMIKFPYSDCIQFSKLENLATLHIYGSKIKSLSGIEVLPIENLVLARNNLLEDIQAIYQLKRLQRINVEKCKKIDYDFIKSLDKGIKVEIIK